MTDRIRHLTVTLDRDTRDDDAEPIIAAICQIRGVAKVDPRVLDGHEIMARRTAALEMENEIHKAVAAIADGKPYTFAPKNR